MGLFTNWMYEEHAEPVHAFHFDGTFFAVYEMPLTENLFTDPDKHKQYKVCWTKNTKGDKRCVLVTASSQEQAANMIRKNWSVVKMAKNADGSPKLGADGQPEKEQVGKAHTGWAASNPGLDAVPDSDTGKPGAVRRTSDALNPKVHALLKQSLDVSEHNPFAKETGNQEMDSAELKRAVEHLLDMIKRDWHYHQSELDPDKRYLMLGAKEVNTLLRGIVQGEIRPGSFRKGTPINTILQALNSDEERALVDLDFAMKKDQEFDKRNPHFKKADPYASKRDRHMEEYYSVVKSNGLLFKHPIIRKLLAASPAAPVAAEMPRQPAGDDVGPLPTQQPSVAKKVEGRPATKPQPSLFGDEGGDAGMQPQQKPRATPRPRRQAQAPSPSLFDQQ